MGLIKRMGWETIQIMYSYIPFSVEDSDGHHPFSTSSTMNHPPSLQLCLSHPPANYGRRPMTGSRYRSHCICRGCPTCGLRPHRSPIDRLLCLSSQSTPSGMIKSQLLLILLCRRRLNLPTFRTHSGWIRPSQTPHLM